jgi:hypothetical protein
MRLRCLLFSVLALFAALGWAAPTRVVHGMAGDPVQGRQRVERIDTLGSTRVLNSLAFAVGGGDRIINGLPEFARQPRWRNQQSVRDSRLATCALGSTCNPYLEPLQGNTLDHHRIDGVRSA